MDYALGKLALNADTSILNPKISQESISKIRKYFNVSSAYVLDKILLIIFPYNYKNVDFGESLYRPDLYIPIMSLSTVILLKAFALGFSHCFHPEKLGMLLSRILFIQIGLALIYKAAAYFFEISMPISDLFCHTGYKFVIIVLNKIIKMFYFGSFFSIYFYVSYLVFLSRSLKEAFVGISKAENHSYVLFGIVGVDLLAILLLS